jgi:ankyrin repeat protein
LPSQLYNSEGTSLAICCLEGQVQVLRSLLVAGHDPEEKTTNFWRSPSGPRFGSLTAAHVCATWYSAGSQAGQLECLRVLVEEGGANIKAADELGETPLHWLAGTRGVKEPRTSIDAFFVVGRRPWKQ